MPRYNRLLLSPMDSDPVQEWAEETAGETLDAVNAERAEEGDKPLTFDDLVCRLLDERNARLELRAYEDAA